MRRDGALGCCADPNRPKNLLLMNMSLELKQDLTFEREIDSFNLDETASRLQDIDNRQEAFANAASRASTRRNRSNQWSP